MNYRKSLVAAVLAVPMLLTACGSDDEADQNASMKQSSSASTSSTDAPEGDKAKQDEEAKKADEAKKAEDAKKAEGEQPAEGQPRPAEGEETAPGGPALPAIGGGVVKPIEGGQPANDEDRQQITAVVDKLGGGTVENYLNAAADNACTPFLERNGGIGAVKQSIAAASANQQFVEVNSNMPKLAVNDIQVNGDHATANVSAAGASDNLPFARENGQWKLCPSS
ncbi:hypothetical protein GC425_05950 [Corynebacterium sp. zg254]|uniref:hypothetical protein n=1 Tax=Corynebacterium sp. zg254 TaxID=2656645 RepID=UPI002151733D|nr:hypothetical protein [Corynebacterium sp. zg254]MCR5914408.1 hypothetical protein [Corynebacterium sp. zg254]